MTADEAVYVHWIEIVGRPPRTEQEKALFNWVMKLHNERVNAQEKANAKKREHER